MHARQVLIGLAVVALNLTSAGCGGESPFPISWLGVHGSGASSDRVRIAYDTGFKEDGDLIRVANARVRPVGASYEITLLTNDEPARGPVPAIRKVACVTVPLPTRTRVAELRDGTDPSRAPRIPPRLRALVTAVAAECQSVKTAIASK